MTPALDVPKIRPTALRERPEPTTVGIYSFPKSGNTWVRQIIASSFGVQKHELGMYVPDMHRQPVCQNALRIGSDRYFFYKSHADRPVSRHARKKLENDCIIHVRRNPLDVFFSYLNYLSDNVTKSAPIRFSSAEDIIGTELFESYFHAFMITGTIQPKFKIAGNWYDATIGWVERAASSEEGPKVVSVRYEDLHATPIESMGRVYEVAGLPTDTLQAAFEEADQRTSTDGRFYWRRAAGTFREFLTEDQIAMFLRHRGADVEAAGYPREFFLP